MPRKRKVASIVFTGAPVATVTGFNTQPAAAQQSQWTINPGGAFTAANSTNAILSANGVPYVCPPTTANVAGDLSGHSRTGIPVKLGAIDTATFGTGSQPCSLFGLGWVAHMTQAASLQANSYTPGDNPPATGVTRGKINDFRISINGVNGFSCHMVWSGSLPFSYRNSTNTLAINPGEWPFQKTLQIESATGCLGLYQVGDPAALVVSAFTVTPPQAITHAAA